MTVGGTFPEETTLKTFMTLATVVLLAGTGTAQAGYTVTFENLPVNVVGGDGTFTSYTPDSAYDPQSVGDLSAYHFNFVNDQSSLVLSGNTATISGTYNIFYGPGTSLVVSSGTYTNVTTITDFGSSTTPVLGTVSGVLTQLQGPSNSAFRDLSYGGNPVILTADYVGDGVDGTITGSLRQDAIAAPEPATLVSALMAGLGGLVYYRRTRRKQAA
jgi:hypothetical protein